MAPPGSVSQTYHILRQLKLSLYMSYYFLTAPDLPRCHYGDTDCIINVSHTLVRQYARTGYSPAAFPQVEPFVVKRFDISDGRTGSLNLKLNFRDVNVEGLSGVKFDRAV